MSSIRNIQLETVSSHQLRPYGDTIFEGYVTFSVPEGQLYASKWGHHENGEAAKMVIKGLVVDFDETMQPDGWHRPILKTLEQVSPGRWHYVINRMYLD